MNKQVITEWIDALESGEFEQGTGRLHSKNNRFCCLGVLCQLAMRSGIEIRVHREPLDEVYTYDGEACIPPISVLQWAGMRTSDDLIERLLCLNDAVQRTFPKIAAYLREILINTGANLGDTDSSKQS